MTQALKHPFPPTWDENSEVLILGSFPSVKSREKAYFYGHPQNRFWKVMAALFSEPVPQTVDERRSFLLRNHVTAWDVIASCTIVGSSDSSIREVCGNDIRPILNGAPIRKVFCNGRKAGELYRRHIQPVTGIEAVCLPSTSPASAAWSLERLTAAWQEILK